VAVRPKELGLHCLRHSYITHLIEAGYDPAFVQTQAGHSHASVTSVYTSVGDDFKQKTIQKMIARRIARPEEPRIPMAEQRRIGYKWNLRTVMAQRNLWKSTELMPLLKSRGINLSESQVYRLVTGTPERIPARTFAALCDILDCEPNDLFEPYVEMRAAKTADAPKRPEDLGVKPGNPIARRVRIVQDDEDG